jgi:hypothetical protein
LDSIELSVRGGFSHSRAFRIDELTAAQLLSNGHRLVDEILEKVRMPWLIEKWSEWGIS